MRTVENILHFAAAARRRVPALLVAGAALLLGACNGTYSKIEIPASSPYEVAYTSVLSPDTSLTAVASGDGIQTEVAPGSVVTNIFGVLVCGSSTRDFIRACEDAPDYACADQQAECSAAPPNDVDPLSVYPKSISYSYTIGIGVDRNTFTSGSVALQTTGGSLGTIAVSVGNATSLNLGARPSAGLVPGWTSVPDDPNFPAWADEIGTLLMFPHWDGFDQGILCADGGTDCTPDANNPQSEQFLGFCATNGDFDIILSRTSSPGVRGLQCGTVAVNVTQGVLDNFNRADGELGANWTGFSDGLHYLIAGEAGQAWYGGPIYWSQGDAFGTSQEAFVTLSSVTAPEGLENGLLLKVQSDPVPANPSNDPDWIKGCIDVYYDSVAHTVSVAAWRPDTQSWTIYDGQPLTMADGDVFGARALASGTIEVYRNGVLSATFTLDAADQGFFNGRGGRIGLWFEQAATAGFDDFGGGTLDLPSPGPV